MKCLKGFDFVDCVARSVDDDGRVEAHPGQFMTVGPVFLSSFGHAESVYCRARYEPCIRTKTHQI
ncbi:hypothetical protein AKJ16_DCAP16447 [Drosera capensis]